jgi:hypothetical protein
VTLRASRGEPASVGEGTRQQPGSRRIGHLRDLLEHNVFVFVVFGVCVTLHTQLLRGEVAGDSWYTLLGGRLVERAGIPHNDTWTVLTLGREWIDEQWLAQLGFYRVWVAGGWGLALLGVVVLYLASFAALAATARHLGASDRAVAASSLVCYLVGVNNSVLRAQIPAYLLFALVLALLVTDARSPSRRVYLVFPLIALWANIHGSVVLGAGLVAMRGATVAGAGLRARSAPRTWLPRSLALLGLPWVCTLCSPYGLQLAHYYRSVLGSGELQQAVSEWAPPTLRSNPVFYALLLVAVWLLSRSGGATTAFERLALLVAGVLALDAERYVIWFALVGAVVLPLALNALWTPAPAPRRLRLNFFLAGVCLAVAITATVATAVRGDLWFERGYPSAAWRAVAAAARSDPKLRVFANEKYADWLLFEDPGLEGRVAYDIRFELLTSAEFASLVAFRNERGVDWQGAVHGYGLLVLDPSSDGESIDLFEHRPGATALFRSDDVVVLRRSGGSSA